MRMEYILTTAPQEQWTRHQYDSAKQIFRECAHNSERLMIMGWLAVVEGARQAKPHFTNIGPSFFLDDSRFTSSSQDAAITATIATSEYAALTGVILETKKHSKSTI